MQKRPEIGRPEFDGSFDGDIHMTSSLPNSLNFAIVRTDFHILGFVGLRFHADGAKTGALRFLRIDSEF